jgi:hypothetical protein
MYKLDDDKKRPSKSISERVDELTDYHGMYGDIVDRGYPHGRAIIHNPDASFMVVINEVDHAEIILKKTNTSIPEAIKLFD